jgi:molecular chaperone GrpE (heat shock protein)
MSELNNNEKKSNEQCKCTKKIVVLEKEIKELKSKLERQAHLIENIIKAIKR